MSFEPVYGVPQMGKIHIPDAVISYPTGGKCVSKYTGVVAFTQSKPAAVERGMYSDEFEAVKLDLDPALLEPVLVQATVSHNQRTVRGSTWQIIRMFNFGTLTHTPSAAIYLALGSTSSDFVAGASGHLGLNTNANTTGAELTTGYSYHRTTGANAGTTAATALDGLFTVSISTSWTATGSSTVQVVGIFDHSNLSSSNLFAEATVSTASVAPSDTVTLTWTINN